MTDNPIMADNSTMTINELERNIFLNAAEVLRMHRVVCLGAKANDFNIACYEYKRNKIQIFAEIVYEFIKKYPNYSYVLTQNMYIKLV